MTKQVITRIRAHARVYHHTNKKDLGNILVEGLRPLTINRPRELQVVDHAFDAVAQRSGIPYKRKGIFAWPDKKKPIFEETVVLEVDVDPDKTLVVHQAWLDLAWGMVEGVFARIRPQYKKTLDEKTAETMFEILRDAQIYEGRLDRVLFELGELYWTTGMPLLEVDMDALTQEVLDMQRRFQGLLPYMAFPEVALGMEVIPPERIRELT